MEDTRTATLQELENAYQQKIMLEVERYGQLEKEREMQRGTAPTLQEPWRMSVIATGL